MVHLFLTRILDLGMCLRVTSMHTMFWRALAFNQDGRCWNIAGVARKTSMFEEIPSKRLVSFHMHGVTMIAKEISRVDRIYYDDQSKG
jgi:hypothetical protein